MQTIKNYGGFAIVQDPKTAESDVLPRAAISCTDVDMIIPLEEIGVRFVELFNSKNAKQKR